MSFTRARAAVEAALRTGRFWLTDERSLRVRFEPQETIHWEVYRGHLLGEGQTRRRETFAAWHVHLDPPGGRAPRPVISVRLHRPSCCLFVTRTLAVYAHVPDLDESQRTEKPGFSRSQAQPGNEPGLPANVVTTRETVTWREELVGTIELHVERGEAGLDAELRDYVFAAVHGTSRLPITSLESPLPDFSLGRLGYFPGEGVRLHFANVSPQEASECGVKWGLTPFPAAFPGALFEQGIPRRRRAAMLELMLRAIDAEDVHDAVEAVAAAALERDAALADLVETFKVLFHHVALSPFTRFVENQRAFLLHLSHPKRLGPEAVIDLFGYFLRHLVRHLTAYDLHRFHSRGANYPDALVLDSYLKALLQLGDRHPEAFGGERQKGVGSLFPRTMENRRKPLAEKDSRPRAEPLRRRRRRAVRQAFVIRRLYEGLAVPDAPTSAGENLRVLPAPFERIDEAQLLDPSARRKRLFENEPAERLVATDARRGLLESSLDDLENPAELCELGTATFLDRPLGVFKQPGEVDRTPLLAYEALSLSVAEERLRMLEEWGLIGPSRRQTLAELLREHRLEAGMPARSYQRPPRGNVVSLEDARIAADDFVFLRTADSSLRRFLNECGRGTLVPGAEAILERMAEHGSRLIIRDPEFHPESTATRHRRPLLVLGKGSSVLFRERWKTGGSRSRKKIPDPVGRGSAAGLVAAGPEIEYVERDVTELLRHGLHFTRESPPRRPR